MLLHQPRPTDAAQVLAASATLDQSTRRKLNALLRPATAGGVSQGLSIVSSGDSDTAPAADADAPAAAEGLIKRGGAAARGAPRSSPQAPAAPGDFKMKRSRRLGLILRGTIVCYS